MLIAHSCFSLLCYHSFAAAAAVAVEKRVAEWKTVSPVQWKLGHIMIRLCKFHSIYFHHKFYGSSLPHYTVLLSPYTIDSFIPTEFSLKIIDYRVSV